MAGALSPSIGLATQSASASDFKFVLTRSDDGRASIVLQQYVTVGNTKQWITAKDSAGHLVAQANAGWDDAIPWAAATGKYKLSYNGAFAGASDSWIMSPDPADRNAILLHQGSQSDPSGPLHGCIGATAVFLAAAEDALSTAGVLNSQIPLDVVNDYNYTIGLTSSTKTLKEGEDATFTITLNGAGGNGISKQLWVRLNLTEDEKPGLAKLGTDYTLEPSKQGVGDVTFNPTDVNQSNSSSQFVGRYNAGFYVLIPKNTSSVTYKIHTNTDAPTQPVEMSEKIDLTIDDYFVVDQYKGRSENYSDFLTQPGVLLKGTLPSAPITITDEEKLKTAHLSGGIEGLQKTFSVTKGDAITYSFNAYTIPDKLTILGGTTTVDTGGFISDVRTGALTAVSDQITVIVVGSNSGTAWDLDLTDTTALASSPASASVMTLASALTSTVTGESWAGEADLGGHVSSSIARAVAGTPATLSKLVTQKLTVPATGETAPVNFAAKAGHDYLVRVFGAETTSAAGDLSDGYFKIREGAAAPVIVESHESNLNGAPSAFFRASADAAASITVGSDVVGQGGSATLEIFDATTLRGSIVFVGDGPTLSASEGDGRGISVPVYRIGDLTQAASYKVTIAGGGTTSISTDDLDGGFATASVTFAPGQGLASVSLNPVDDGRVEGLERGVVTLDLSGDTSGALANAQLLGLSTSQTFTIDDGTSIPSLLFPTATIKNADAKEAAGYLDFEINLSAPSRFATSLSYTTVDETAQASKDYDATSGKVTFAPGETVQHVRVAVLKDGVVEPDETVSLKLLNASGITFGGGRDVITATGTVHDSPVPLDAVYRFYDTATGDHFYTIDPNEKSIIQKTLSTYLYEGVDWAVPEKGADTTDIFRFYDTKTSQHFFTSDAHERDQILSTLPTYLYEGVALQAYKNPSAEGSLTLERFYNTGTGLHHYSASAGETADIKAGLVGANWLDEGPSLVVHAPTSDMLTL